MNISLTPQLERLKEALAEGVKQAEAGDVESLTLEQLLGELNARKLFIYPANRL